MRRRFLFAVLGVTVVLAVGARIYEEVVKHARPETGPPVLRFWKNQAQLPVDLSGFFNNDGVASASDPSDSNFDCPDHPPNVSGSGYAAELLPPSGAIFRVPKAGYAFLFPVLAERENNNATCCGQRLGKVIPAYGPEGERRFSELAFLGAAENGAASATLTLEYEDGGTESAVLGFPDWCAKPAADEIVAVSAAYRYAWDDRAQKNAKQTIDCRLYVRRIPVDPDRRLSAVVLPEKPNLHVFAITLHAAVPCAEAVYAADAVAVKYHRAAQLGKAPPADVKGLLAPLAKALDEAEPKIEAKLRRQFVWLRAQYGYLAFRLGDGIVRRGSATEQWALRTGVGLRSDVEMLLNGDDPFRTRRGEILKGYISDIDGQIQPYGLYVPNEYRPGAATPLVVSMHGHGWYRPFQGIPAAPVRDAIILSPHGRGSMDYMFVAEEDVLACIEEVKKDYTVDAGRIYLVGHSMGGTGCWSLATRYPDRFAAVGPSAANADSKAWSGVAGRHGNDAGSYAWLRAELREALDPVTLAPNLLHVPAYFLHGDDDRVVPVENSRSMSKALTDAGCRFVYREGKGAGHGWRPGDLVSEQLDFLFSSARPDAPRRVILRAPCLKYGKAYWVRVLRFDRSDRLAEVAADVRGESIVDVKLANVSAIEFDLHLAPVNTSKAVIIAVDGRPAFTDVPPSDGRVILVRAGSRWRPVSGLSGLHKKPYLEGPVSNAFTRSYVIVVGTKSADAADGAVLRAEVEQFAADWELLYTKPPRVKNDRDVTGDDIAHHNLILYGGAADNTVTARIADRLPIRFEGGAVRVGDRTYRGQGVGAKFCYPNPLNPERMVVVIAGAARAADVFQSNNLLGNWFQWGPYDNRAWFDYAVFDRKTWSEETCLEFGFFGGDWQFNRETTWFGDAKERERASVRRVPACDWPPEKSVVYLSELMPASIEQHKQLVGFDTSSEGRGLSIGPTPVRFDRGLGVRPPSKLRFNVNRPGTATEKGFTRFLATVGVDLEGEKNVPTWRDKQEWVKFLVYGDGHLVAQTGQLKWNSKPVDVDVPIARYKELELEAWCSPARWLVGSAAWGNARIVVDEPKPPK